VNYKDINDYEILYMVSENDSARELLIKKYLPVVHKIASKYLPVVSKCGIDYDDLIQEGMIALDKAISSYKESSNTLFYTYANLCVERHMIVVCRLSNNGKQLLLNESVDDECFVFLKDYTFDPANLLDSYTIEKEFLRCKNLMDLKCSTVFELRYNGFSYREISVLLDIPLSTIDGRLYRIRKLLREITKKVC